MKRLLEKKNSKTQRTSLTLTFVVICLVLFKGCYPLQHASGHLSINWSQIPLEEAIDAEEDERYKKLLLEVEKIVAFANDFILLEKSSNYTEYYRTDQDALVYTVTAAEKLALKPYKWWYPIIGELPFHGHYKKFEALNYAKEMVRRGYDVYIFGAPAYSTLGWFTDPITTPMLKNGLFYLTEMIIHEMTHATFYVKDQGGFNEQVASFVGRIGAEQYFRLQVPDGEKKLKEIKENRKKYREFRKMMLGVAGEAKKLYAKNLTSEQILEQREMLFEETIKKIFEMYPNSSENFRVVNNARLMQFKRYRSDSQYLVDIFQENSNWKDFWNELKNNTESVLEDYKKFNDS